MPIKAFTDLKTWQEGHVLVIEVFRITKDFPSREMYSLVDQMRRCSVSITSNIAEGFGRQTYKEKLQFYFIAQGSLTELKNQLLIARDVGYLKNTNYNSILEKSNGVHQLLQGLIQKTKSFI